MHARPGALRYRLYLAVDRAERTLRRSLLQRPYVRHRHRRTQHGLAHEHDSIHYAHLVVGVRAAGNQREGVFAAHEQYLDSDTVDLEPVLHEKVDVQPPHHLDDSTPRYVPPSLHQTRIAGVLLRRFHVSGRILVPQMASELSLLRLGAVTQKRFDVGTKRVGVRRRRHERVVEVYVHLAEQRMEPIVQGRHRCIVGDVGAYSANHLGANEQISVGTIDVSVSGSGYDEFYRATRIERRDRLVLYPATVFDASLRRWYGEQVQFALHSIARLPVNERHARKTRLLRRYGVFSQLALRVVFVYYHVDVQLVSRVFRAVTMSRAYSVANLFPQSSSSVSPQSGYSHPIIHHQQICAPVFNARFPSAIAPRLISGATDRRRPPNKLPNPCPRWTRAPAKYGSAPPTCCA